MRVLRRPESFLPHFVSFAWQYRECTRRFAPTAGGCPLPWAWTFGLPEPNRDSFAEISGFSQVPGPTLLCTCPGRVPRGTLGARPDSATRVLPSAHPTTSAPLFGLSRLVTTACTLAVYASRRQVTLTRRKTRFRWGGHPLPGRTRTYWIGYEEFQDRLTSSFLPSQASPGARSVSAAGTTQAATTNFRRHIPSGRWLPQGRPQVSDD